MPDHVHMLLSIPPKYAVSQVVGSSRVRALSTWPGFMGAQAQFRRATLLGQRILRDTVGRDEEAIRAYIRNQEQEDQRLEQLNLWR